MVILHSNSAGDFILDGMPFVIRMPRLPEGCRNAARRMPKGCLKQVGILLASSFTYFGKIQPRGILLASFRHYSGILGILLADSASSKQLMAVCIVSACRSGFLLASFWQQSWHPPCIILTSTIFWQEQCAKNLCPPPWGALPYHDMHWVPPFWPPILERSHWKTPYLYGLSPKDPIFATF